MDVATILVTFSVAANGWSYAVPSVGAGSVYTASPGDIGKAVSVVANSPTVCFDGTGRVLLADCSGPPAVLPQLDVVLVARRRECMQGKQRHCQVPVYPDFAIGAGARVRFGGRPD
ncbi:hypothetical protein UB46_03755 [Burkholderiaceae bacterium 16]|nr:hypothetical protein UB46_03755 [Burkholderiaceae bacterium 16]